MLENIPSYSELHTLLFDVDRIPFAIMAILLTIVLGVIAGPRAGNANPMMWIWVDKMFGRLGDKLDKNERPAADLMFRGFFIMVLAVLFGALLGEASKVLIDKYQYYGAVEALLISLALGGGAVWFVLLRLYFALEQGQMAEGAYYGVARTTRINLNSTDDYGITRIGMAMAARSFDKGIVAPVLWFLIGGYTALFVYAALAATAWRFGKDGFSSGFGSVPLAIEKLVGFVPSMLAAFIMSLASTFTPTASIFKSIASWWKKGAPYAQGGLPLTAMAWALNVTLGGAAQDINGSSLKSAWVGPEKATAKNDHHHLKRAMYINIMAHLLFIVALLVAYIWSSL